MIEKEIERQIAYLHAVYGLVAGVVLGIYFNGEAIPFLSALIWGFMISYPAMFITKSVFKLKSEDFTVKTWIGKGFLYFFSMWLVAWVFVYNLR